MQYSKDGFTWTFSRASFDEDKIVKSLGIKRGDLIYYRENADGEVKTLQYGKSNERSRYEPK